MTPAERLKQVFIGLDGLVNQARDENAPKSVFTQIETTLGWLHLEIAPEVLASTLKSLYLENTAVIQSLLKEPMFNPTKYN